MTIDSFFDNLEELVFISDFDTDELLKVNKFCRRFLKLKPASKLSSIKCYEVLHDDPFSNPGYSQFELKEGYFFEWAYYDTLTHKYYNRKATIIDFNGKKVRLEIAIDTSSENTALDIVNELSANERFINTAMMRALDYDDPDKSIKNLLSSLGQKLLCTRVSLFEPTIENSYSVTYEWVVDGHNSFKKERQNLNSEELTLWLDLLDKQGHDIVSDTSKPNSKKYGSLLKSLAQKETITAVATKVKVPKNKIGFLLVENSPEYKLENISSILSVISHFLFLLIKQRNNVNQLSDFSYHDYMTGTCNRHALTRTLNTATTHNIGLIMCDLNGLKSVNDHEGHEAGDRLILSLSDSLLSIYTPDQVYRLGGDEFLVLRLGIKESELQDELEDLRKLLHKNKVAVAIGAAWSNKGVVDFDNLLKVVDDKMYEDKRNFYGYVRASFANSSEN